jgi:hypothetical protein
MGNVNPKLSLISLVSVARPLETVLFLSGGIFSAIVGWEAENPALPAQKDRPTATRIRPPGIRLRPPALLGRGTEGRSIDGPRRLVKREPKEWRRGGCLACTQVRARCVVFHSRLAQAPDTR